MNTEALIRRAATMLGAGADVSDVRAMLVGELRDVNRSAGRPSIEANAFLVMQAARLFARFQEEDP